MLSGSKNTTEKYFVLIENLNRFFEVISFFNYYYIIYLFRLATKTTIFFSITNILVVR